MFILLVVAAVAHITMVPAVQADLVAEEMVPRVAQVLLNKAVQTPVAVVVVVIITQVMVVQEMVGPGVLVL